MTRKISLSVLLILLLILCYKVIFSNSSFIRSQIASVSQLKSAHEDLENKMNTLNNKSITEFEEQKKQLKKIINEYRNSKKEYEDMVAQYSEQEKTAMIQAQEKELKDIYDVDFLWTIVGNYATEEGINLKFDVSKNLTSASSLNNTSSNYVVCDLKFTITGAYINLTNFIYDLEDDDRLGFEINDFDMQKNGTDLQVTLNVKEIKLNSSNLIDKMPDIENKNETSEEEKEEDSTQKVNATTSQDKEN